MIKLNILQTEEHRVVLRKSADSKEIKVGGGEKGRPQEQRVSSRDGVGIP